MKSVNFGIDLQQLQPLFIVMDNAENTLPCRNVIGGKKNGLKYKHTKLVVENFAVNKN